LLCHAPPILPRRAAGGKSLTFDRPCDGDSGEGGATEHDFS